ncbi:hypothetical protein [Agaribacterium haliotis]|uniref:hypothetical protein n=1 Tax=Agaribacterium haliotis TaxID=2013869 RepID=UPI000BB540EC|nr:hypothetical protein [Agaribacterium haliotis]
MPAAVSVFLQAARDVSAAAPKAVILALGIVLIFNGLHLLWTSTLARPAKLLIWYFIAGDVLWVLVSLSLIAGGLWISAAQAIWATMAVALMVTSFAALQLYYLRRY